MERTAGFLESDVERTLTERDAPADNVVPLGDSLRSQTQLREREHHFHDLLNALPVAVYTTDAVGRITYYNEAAAELWGQRPALGTRYGCGSWKLFWPDGTPMAQEDCPLAVALKEDRPVRGVEAVCERPDGTRVPFIPHPTPLHDEAGRLIGAVNTLVDISERNRAEEQQTLLVRELHHRVKNTLATVQAIMGSTARASRSIDEFNTALIGRIGALARTHLLLSDDSGVATFAEILHNELDAFDDGSGERIKLSGPEVVLPSRLAVSLGMAIHELATNAAKHGALSVFGGTVEVAWTMTIEAARTTLNIEWTETGGPPVVAPERKGFGLRLLDFVLPGQIQAVTTVDYRREGFHVTCVVPLPADEK